MILQWEVIHMKEVRTTEEKVYPSTTPVIQSYPYPKKMVNDSMEAEEKGRAMSISELKKILFSKEL
jgi:hypothetical protein